MFTSDRLNKLPPYLFDDLDRKKRALLSKGADIIDLTIGDPDLPTPRHVVEALYKEAMERKNQRYSPYSGVKEFKDAAANYLLKSRKVKLNPESEILTLIGSKEGIGHAPFAFLNDGDVALVPSPGYPVYSSSVLLAGGGPYEMPLRKENNFLPDLKAIPKNILKKAKIIFINYPNNPTSAIATIDFFKEIVSFAHENNILILHDAAYIEMTFDGCKANSILEVEGAKDTAIEFHSLSKTYNMTGWRLGFAAGNKAAIASLGKFKTMVDSSAVTFVQKAGAEALNGDQSCVKETCGIYKERREIFEKGLKKAGINYFSSNATFYVWAEEPMKDFASYLLEKVNVAITPGIGFGEFGRGYIRFSMTSKRTNEAIERILNC